MDNIIKEKARELRRSGHSFKEVGLELGIARSTVSVWTRSEELNEAARLRLRERSDLGRAKGVRTMNLKRQAVLEDIDSKCGVLINKDYQIDEYKLLLAALYWGEGAKTDSRLAFINSDPGMIKTYLWLLRKCFEINESRLKCRLHLHEYHNRKAMILFWSKVTGIPKTNFSIYNKPHTGINKKPGYKGCLSIRYGDSRILKEIFIIIERFKNLANIAGLV